MSPLEIAAVRSAMHLLRVNIKDLEATEATVRQSRNARLLANERTALAVLEAMETENA